MSDITRFNYDEGDGNWRFPGFLERDDGEWVEYADHIAIVEDLKRQLEMYEAEHYNNQIGGALMNRQEYCADRPKRFVVCAANKYGPFMFTGIRHFCPVMRFNMAHYDIPGMRNEFGEVQGFIDQYGVFMDRREAAVVAAEAGQLDRYGAEKPDVLFSEDLY